MFGLVGEKLSHSYSALIHAELGDYEYKLLPVARDQFEDFIKERGFEGLNVTIPYKKMVMPFCHELSDAARAIGSVNTVKVRPDGSLFGDNTDYYGFLYLADKTGIDFNGKKVLVLGSGGTSLTVCKAVSDRGGNPIIISRSGENNYSNISRHYDAGVIVNTTPVGMYPETHKAPVDLTGFSLLEGVLDVIYNPMRTRLVQQAGRLGIKASCGLPMLVAQAKRSAEIFMDKELDDQLINKITAKLRCMVQNIVLIGMPGSGKSTIGRETAKKLGMPFVDLDSAIAEKSGKSIPEIFADEGEAGFRKLEAEVTAEISKTGGRVIAAGGGTPLDSENRKNLRQNSLVVLISRDISQLPTEGRPLSQDADLEKMLQKRQPYYLDCADVTIENNGSPEKCAAEILEVYHENTCD